MANKKISELVLMSDTELVSASDYVPIVDDTGPETKRIVVRDLVAKTLDDLGVSNVTYGDSNVAVFLPTYAGNLSAGNVSVTGDVSATFFRGNGSLLTGIVIPPSYTNANVAAYLPTHTGNISGGNLTVTGDVSATFFRGNGSLLTGIVSGGSSSYGDSNVAVYLPTHTGNILAGNLIVISSAILGPNNIVSGDYEPDLPAFAIGYQNNAFGAVAIVIGRDSQAIGSGAISIGDDNFSRGQDAITIGDLNNIYGRDCIAIGNGNEIQGGTPNFPNEDFSNTSYSFAFGLDNIIEEGGDSNFVFGKQSYIYQNAEDSFTFGYTNEISANSTFCYAIGENNRVGRVESYAFGFDNRLENTNRSLAFGVSASVTANGQISTGFGLGTTRGTAQHTEFGLFGTTTNSTPKEIFTNIASERAKLRANCFWAIDSVTSATSIDGGNVAMFSRRLLVKNFNGTANLIGNVQVIASDVGSELGSPPSGWNVDHIVDSPNSSIQVRVTGSPTGNVRWFTRLSINDMLING